MLFRENWIQCNSIISIYCIRKKQAAVSNVQKYNSIALVVHSKYARIITEVNTAFYCQSSIETMDAVNEVCWNHLLTIVVTELTCSWNYVIKKYGSASYLGMAQVQNGHLYM